MLVPILILYFFIESANSSFLGFKINDHSPFEEVSGSKEKSNSAKANCMICKKVFQEKFDYQNLIDQAKCDSISQKYPISASECIVLSKNIAYRFFDNGGDSFFEPALSDKVKACRNSLDFEKAESCQESWPTVCDLLLSNPAKECFDVANSEFKENIFGIVESPNKETQFPRFKETFKAEDTLENTKFESQLKEAASMKLFNSPKTAFPFKGGITSIDELFKRAQELEEYNYTKKELLRIMKKKLKKPSKNYLM